MNKNYLRRLIREYHDNQPYIDTLLALDDTPTSYAGQGGKVVSVKDTEDGVEFTTVSGGTSDHTTLTNRDSADQHPISAITNLQTTLDAKAEAFVSLSDAPSSYSGGSGKVLAVKSTEDGLEFVSAGSGSGDMLASTYDPTSIEGDVFARANHTGTQALSTISDAGDAAALDVGTTAGTVAAGDHNHSGVYEPADATILKDADIGVNVEAYDSTILKDADIGVNVQAYDADIPTVSASQAEMEAGTETALRSMSPLRVAQAVAALASGGGGGGGWDEEGTWTPTIVRTDGSDHPGIVYRVQAGYFKRLGTMVYVSGAITWDSCTSDNSVLLLGLPYTFNTYGTLNTVKNLNVTLLVDGSSNLNPLIGILLHSNGKAYATSTYTTVNSGTGTIDRGFAFSGFYMTNESV